MNANRALAALFSLSLASFALPGISHAADAAAGNNANTAANAVASTNPAGKKILASYHISLGYVDEAWRFLNEHGTEWFAILDDCSYRAFSRGENPAPEVVQGSLSEEECRKLTSPLPLTKTCTNVRLSRVTDHSTKYISAGGKTLSCYISCCGKTEESGETPECKIEKEAEATLAKLLTEGKVQGGKLRGYAYDIKDELRHGRKFSDKENNPLKFTEPLPAGIALSRDTFHRSKIFPDKTQGALRAILEKVKDGTLKTEYSGGIPVKDANGSDVLLFMRPAADIEDAATGKIAFDNKCSPF